MVSGDPGRVLAALTLGVIPHPIELCNQKAAEDFGQYFYPEVVEGRLTCVNNCTQGAKSQLNCNLGRCQLLRSGPHCV